MLPDWSQSKYNQWWIRKFLKVISGIIFTLALIGPIFGLIETGTIIFFLENLLLFAVGSIVWLIFYKLELDVRRNSPEHIILV